MPRVKNDQFEGDIIHIPFFNKTIRMRTVNKDGFLCVEDLRDMYRLHRREYDIRMMIIQYKEEGHVEMKMLKMRVTQGIPTLLESCALA